MQNQILSLIVIVVVQTSVVAQCFLDRHSTNWYDGWLSCEERENPNPERGASHWILYNFGKAASLGELQIWNTNDPQNLSSGIRQASLDYSMDGFSWKTWGDFTVPEAEGLAIYEGVDGPDLAGIQAQYILINADENHGGDCFGFGEIRFHLTDEQVAEETTNNMQEAYCLAAQVHPNPFESSPTLSVQSNCESRATYRIHDAMGKLIVAEDVPAEISNWQNQIPTKSWVPGIYFLNIYYGRQKQVLKLVKM
ncbi:MAG: T9SS type A sorting domain-containing protein [Saprospiraceae bacterium]|nr:T9SS type A sorting domain-containing protein [Saprospiraceae bacterium]